MAAKRSRDGARPSWLPTSGTRLLQDYTQPTITLAPGSAARSAARRRRSWGSPLCMRKCASGSAMKTCPPAQSAADGGGYAALALHVPRTRSSGRPAAGWARSSEAVHRSKVPVARAKSSAKTCTQSCGQGPGTPRTTRAVWNAARVLFSEGQARATMREMATGMLAERCEHQVVGGKICLYTPRPWEPMRLAGIKYRTPTTLQMRPAMPRWKCPRPWCAACSSYHVIIPVMGGLATDIIAKAARGRFLAY